MGSPWVHFSFALISGISQAAQENTFHDITVINTICKLRSVTSVARNNPRDKNLMQRNYKISNFPEQILDPFPPPKSLGVSIRASFTETKPSSSCRPGGTCTGFQSPIFDIFRVSVVDLWHILAFSCPSLTYSGFQLSISDISRFPVWIFDIYRLPIVDFRSIPDFNRRFLTYTSS